MKSVGSLLDRPKPGESTATGLKAITYESFWHKSGYEPLVASVAAHTLSFGKPVLMFNGDSHVYQSSNPLSATDPAALIHPGYDVPNFHRVVVHGSTLPLEYLKLTVDRRASAPNGATAFGPFSWTEVVPATP